MVRFGRMFALDRKMHHNLFETTTIFLKNQLIARPLWYDVLKAVAPLSIKPAAMRQTLQQSNKPVYKYLFRQVCKKIPILSVDKPEFWPSGVSLSQRFVFTQYNLVRKDNLSEEEAFERTKQYLAPELEGLELAMHTVRHQPGAVPAHLAKQTMVEKVREFLKKRGDRRRTGELGWRGDFLDAFEAKVAKALGERPIKDPLYGELKYSDDIDAYKDFRAKVNNNLYFAPEANPSLEGLLQELDKKKPYPHLNYYDPAAPWEFELRGDMLFSEIDKYVTQKARQLNGPELKGVPLQTEKLRLLRDLHIYRSQRQWTILRNAVAANDWPAVQKLIDEVRRDLKALASAPSDSQEYVRTFLVSQLLDSREADAADLSVVRPAKKPGDESLPEEAPVPHSNASHVAFVSFVTHVNEVVRAHQLQQAMKENGPLPHPPPLNAKTPLPASTGPVNPMMKAFANLLAPRAATVYDDRQQRSPAEMLGAFTDYLAISKMTPTELAKADPARTLETVARVLEALPDRGPEPSVKDPAQAPAAAPLSDILSAITQRGGDVRATVRGAFARSNLRGGSQVEAIPRWEQFRVPGKHDLMPSHTPENELLWKRHGAGDGSGIISRDQMMAVVAHLAPDHPDVVEKNNRALAQGYANRETGAATETDSPAAGAGAGSGGAGAATGKGKRAAAGGEQKGVKLLGRYARRANVKAMARRTKSH